MKNKSYKHLQMTKANNFQKKIPHCIASSQKTIELDSNEECLIALGPDEEEVTSNSFDFVSSSFESKESIVNLMKDCQDIMATHSQLKDATSNSRKIGNG